MSPAPLGRSLHGWVRANESTFLSKVQSSNGFQKLLGSYSKSLGADCDSNGLQTFAEDLCKVCLHEADDVLAGEGPIAAVMQEAEMLKAKLTQCNLSTMKQMAAMRTSAHSQGKFRDDTVTFHEPLQYLDEDQKELVLSIVCDKLRQIRSGHLPPSLMEALTRYANAQASQDEVASMEELQQTKAELEKSRSEARLLRVKLGAAEELAEELRTELGSVKEKLRETESAIAELKEQHATLQEAHEQLQALSAEQQAEIGRQQEEIERQKAQIEKLCQELEEERRANATLRIEVQRLEEVTAKQQAQIEEQQVVIEKQQAEIDRLSQELQAERAANAKLRAHVEQLQDQLRKLEKAHAELQERYDVLEKEADEMRAELARRNNTRTASTQTSLSGSKMDEQAAERKQLKVMLEEMQMKLKELIEQYRKKFGSEAKEVAKELGIDQLLKEDTVFQRLYDDALERVDRLEKLRSRIRKERKDLGVSPEPAQDVPVLASVEKSDLKGIRRFLNAPEDSEPQQQAASKRPEIAASPPKTKMQASVSLPSLHSNAQAMAVLNLNLGSKQKGSRRNVAC